MCQLLPMMFCLICGRRQMTLIMSLQSECVIKSHIHHSYNSGSWCSTYKHNLCFCCSACFRGPNIVVERPVLRTLFYFKKIKVKVNVSSYVVQHPIIRITQSALHFTSLADLFNQISSQLLWEAHNTNPSVVATISKHILQNDFILCHMLLYRTERIGTETIM